MNTFDAALVFKTIIQQGSMVKAAEALHIHPSVISKKLVYLENQLGLQLLKRTTRNIELTEAGHIFYERITALSNNWDASIEEVKDLNDHPKGTLRICSPQPLSSRFIAPILQDFQQQYPDIKFELIHASYEQLPHNNADITICRKLENFNSSNFVGVPLHTYQNGLYASPAYLRNRPKIESHQDLEKQNCIVYKSGKDKYIWQFDNQKKIEIQPSLIADNTEVIISSAVNHLGIAYIPAVILPLELQQKTLVPVLPNYQSKIFETYIYYQKMEFIPLKMRVFIDYLKKSFI